MKLCLDRGADVNATNSLKLAAIHGAANRGWTPIIQVLADHGAKLDLKDIADRTPLMFAEGTFLAVRPPSAKPEAVALLRRLMGDNTATDNVGSARGRGQGPGRGRSGR